MSASSCSRVRPSRLVGAEAHERPGNGRARGAALGKQTSNEKRLSPQQGRKARTYGLRGPTLLRRRLAAAASKGANTPRLANGSTRRRLLHLAVFRRRGFRESFGLPRRRLASTAGSLRTGRSVLFSFHALIMRLLCSEYHTVVSVASGDCVDG